MLDFNFSEEELSLRETIRRFAERRVMPLFDKAELDHQFPREIFTDLAEMGLLCCTVPEERGGAGASKVAESIVIAELSRASSSCASAYMVHSGVATSAIAEYGTADQRERFLGPAIRGETIAAFALTEPDAGSDAAGIRTSARQVPGGYVLNGRKMYITNGSIAGFTTVAAVTEPQARRGHGISLFVVPAATPGFRVGGVLEKVGHHSADTAELLFNDCFVDDSLLIGSEGQGFAMLGESLTSGRIAHAARSLGLAGAAFDMALDYAMQRHAFGERIADFQAIAFALSDMFVRLESAQLLMLRAAWLHDEGRDCCGEASMAKLAASEAAEFITGRAMHIFGGIGYMAESRIQRLWRDAKLFPITEGTSEIQRIIISRGLLGQRAGQHAAPASVEEQRDAV